MACFWKTLTAYILRPPSIDFLPFCSSVAHESMGSSRRLPAPSPAVKKSYWGEKGKGLKKRARRGASKCMGGETLPAQKKSTCTVFLAVLSLSLSLPCCFLYLYIRFARAELRKQMTPLPRAQAVIQKHRPSVGVCWCTCMVVHNAGK